MPSSIPQGRAYGSVLHNIPIGANDYWLQSNEDNITAHAGGGQALAYQITTQQARITTVATAGDSVQLPPAVPGMSLLLTNHGANAMQVYGNSAAADTIDDIATGTGVSQMANSVVLYACNTSGKWYSEGLATGYSTQLGLQTQSYAAIAANATGTQASGTAVTATINTVSSGGAAYSVTLPPAVPGVSIQIICVTGTNTVAVFPNAGGTTTEKINALSANAGITMGALTSATFVCVAAGQWWTNPRVPS